MTGLHICSIIFSNFVLLLLLDATNGYNYGTITPYNLTPSLDWAKLVKDTHVPQNCTLAHFRFVARHGTRQYSQSNIDRTVAAVKKIIGATKHTTNNYPASSNGQDDGPITKAQLLAIQNWADQIGGKQDLVDRGRVEHAVLAREYFKLLNASGLIQRANFSFEASNVKRARESGASFRDQFDKLTGQTSPEPIRVNDTHLFFLYKCPAYLERIQTNTTINQETPRSRSTPETKRLIEKINQNRFLFPENILSYGEISAMYQTAGFEKAIFNSSVFEPLFNDEDEDYLAYVADLSNYWSGAYGAKLTGDMSCALTNDIFEMADTAFRARKQGQKVTTSGFGFTHVEILLPIYAGLGLFNDSKNDFIASAPSSFYKNRKFNAAKIGGFASNIAFLFFDCPAYSAPLDQRLLVLVNGIAHHLPLACPSTLHCPVSSVKTAYPLITGSPNKCNFAKMCSLN